MDRSTLGIDRDYNRSPAPPSRGPRAAASWLAAALAALWRWIGAPQRRTWAPPLLGAALLFALFLPFDGTINAWAGRFQPRGDLRRELEAAQQYGALGSLLMTAAVIWLLDPARRRRLLDLLAAVALTGIAVGLLKMLVGRPRPRVGLDDPHYFLGPFGVYPLPPRPGVRDQWELRHAWELWGNISSDLWSLPSSHTAYAVALSVFLAIVYPRLRPLAIVMAGVVALCRILFGAHYPTDVIAGAAVGMVLAGPAVKGYWGVRALDWLWIRLIDRGATPAFPAMAREAQRSSVRAESSTCSST